MQYLSSPTKRKMDTRGKRLQEIAKSTSSAPCLANSSAPSFSGRNKCPGTHCCMIVKKEKENSSCQICRKVCGKRERRSKGQGDKHEARVGEKEKSREMADLLVLPRPAKGLQNGAGFSGKTSTNWACRKRKNGFSAAK